MQGITPFQSGRPLLSEVTADKLNKILAEIKRNRPVVSAPLSARVTGDGTFISVIQKPGASAVIQPTKPWELYGITGVGEANEETGLFPNYEVNVWPGLVNDLLPANVSGANGPTAFSVSGSSLVYFKAVCSGDGKTLTSVSIEADTTAPVAQEAALFAAPADLEICFAMFYQGAVFRTIGNSNITATSYEFLREDSDTPYAYGKLNYKSWYAWSVTS